MHYCASNEEDNKLHQAFHKQHTKGLRFNATSDCVRVGCHERFIEEKQLVMTKDGLKKRKTRVEYPIYKIPANHKQIPELLSQLKQLMNSDDKVAAKDVYICIHEREVIGVLVTEAIECSYRARMSQFDVIEIIPGTKTPSEIGISRIWVREAYRREGIATSMLKLFDLNRIAFSQITRDDFKLASKLQGDSNVRVYI